MERCYEIHVRGRLAPAVLRDLPHVTSGPPQVRTVLRTGPLDPATLHELLVEVETLGVELVEVRTQGSPNYPARVMNPQVTSCDREE